MRDAVRVVFVGDEGVGKSTIVNACASGEYNPTLPKNVGVKEFPSSVTPEGIRLTIVDTDSFPLDGESKEKAACVEEVKKADVVCLVVDCCKQTTLDNLGDFWLPWLTGAPLSLRSPIVIVANKLDLQPEDRSQERVDSVFRPLMAQFSTIETALECSAKTMQNLQEVFRFAQMAVLHPTLPIYNTDQHMLNERCLSAMHRVFVLCDRDGDGLLSDKEMSDFQHYCFGDPLSESELASVKKVIEGFTGGSGLTNSLINESGFVALHLLFVHRGRMETVWTVLRKFGYTDEGDELVLDPAYKWPAKLDRDVACGAYELSSEALAFLRDKFTGFLGRLGRSSVTLAALGAMFSVDPSGSPFSSAMLMGVPLQANGEIDERAFVALWGLLCLKDVRSAVRALAYLGFDPRTTLPVRSFASRNRRARARRNFLHCVVCGDAKTGKTTLLSKLVGGHADDPRGVQFTAGEYRHVVGAAGKTDSMLVMTELPAANALTVLQMPSDRLMADCDAVVVMYTPGSAASLAFAENCMAALTNAPMPVLLVAGFADKVEAPADGADEAGAALCARMGVSGPLPFDGTRAGSGDVLAAIAESVATPQKYLIMDAEQRRKAGASSSSSGSVLVPLLAAGAVAVLALGAWFAYSTFVAKQDDKEGK